MFRKLRFSTHLKTSLILFTVLAGFHVSAQNDKDLETQKAVQQAMAAMMGRQNCEIPPVYSFNHDFDMVMHQLDKKGKEEMMMKMRCYLDDKSSRFGYELLESSEKRAPQAKMIMESDLKTMVTLIDQGGQRMAMCMDLSKVMAYREDREIDDPMGKMTKTGRTRTILGYTCQEWTTSEDGTTTLFWITDKAPLPMGRFYKAMAHAKSSPFGGGGGLPTDGMMLGMESVNAKGEKTTMEVTALHPDHASTISTEGYQRF